MLCQISLGIRKVIYALFFTARGPITHVAMPKGKEINTKPYKNNIGHFVPIHFKLHSSQNKPKRKQNMKVSKKS
mgnify:CR=1 FL=1